MRRYLSLLTGMTLLAAQGSAWSGDIPAVLVRKNHDRLEIGRVAKEAYDHAMAMATLVRREVRDDRYIHILPGDLADARKFDGEMWALYSTLIRLEGMLSRHERAHGKFAIPMADARPFIPGAEVSSYREGLQRLIHADHGFLFFRMWNAPDSDLGSTAAKMYDVSRRMASPDGPSEGLYRLSFWGTRETIRREAEQSASREQELKEAAERLSVIGESLTEGKATEFASPQRPEDPTLRIQRGFGGRPDLHRPIIH